MAKKYQSDQGKTALHPFISELKSAKQFSQLPPYWQKLIIKLVAGPKRLRSLDYGEVLAILKAGCSYTYLRTDEDFVTCVPLPLDSVKDNAKGLILFMHGRPSHTLDDFHSVYEKCIKRLDATVDVIFGVSIGEGKTKKIKVDILLVK